MKIRLLSDLHLEMRKFAPLQMVFKKKADVVILAGDIGNPYTDDYKKLIEYCSSTHEKVIVVCGNHEYYNKRTMSKIDSKIRQLCADEDNIHFLQTDSVIHNKVKFIGCTL